MTAARPPLAVRVAVSIVSAFLTLVAIEIAGHMVNPAFAAADAGNLVDGHFQRLYAYHHRLGWVPASRTTARKWGTTVRTGPDGLRLNGHPLDESRLDSQILVLGDSYTFGDEVADADTWPAHLERQLQTGSGWGYQVLNAGVSSYGIDQMVLRAEDLVPKYRPRLVILSFISANIGRTLQSVRHGVPKPYFEVRGGQLELRNVPAPAPVQHTRYRKWILDRSATARMLGRVDPFARFFGTMADTQIDTSRSAHEIAGLLFDRLLALGDAYGFHLLVALVPQAEGDEADAPTLALLRRLNGTGDETVLTVDGTEALRRRAGEQPLDGFYLDVHFSSAGNAWMAEALAPSARRLLQ